MAIAKDLEADQQAGERERAHRSNLFLAASIEAAGTNVPVKIRNLSETGAMLEAPSFPAVGTVLILKRQELDIEARIVWIAPPRCGVAFEGRIKVSDWVTGKRSNTGFGQDVADEASPAAQAAAPPSAPVAALKREHQPALEIDERVAEELAYVRRIVDAIADELADEPIFLQRHARTLQSFDLAGQILGNLANVLKAEDRDAAIKAIGMEELRARLLRKRLFRPD